MRIRVRTIVALLCLVLLQAVPSPAVAIEEFSLHGVRFGMTRAEVESLWVKTGDNDYTIPGSSISQVKTSFDLDKRLYEVSFVITLDFPEDPPALVASAMQRAFEGRWGRDPFLAVSTIVQKNQAATITVVQKKMRDVYVRKLEEQITSRIKP